MNWSDSRVTVTGGAGFLGSYVVEALRARGCTEIFVPRSRDFDLRDEKAIRRLFHEARPSLVIHLAARVGGIGANEKNPGSFLYDNLMMGTQLFEVARQEGLQKLVALGTVCSYPKFTPVPFREADIWNGYPEETNAPYGLAKKLLLVLSRSYRQQYGFNSIVLFPANLYGPRDNFDPASSHVIPALIRKCLEAAEKREPTVTVWGDGSPTREFLHARDAAEGILLAAERYDSSEPVNLGTNSEISIAELVQQIAALTDFEGRISWDPSRPNGQPRRKLDTSLAEKLFGFRAQTPFAEGLAETIAWYRQQSAVTIP